MSSSSNATTYVTREASNSSSSNVPSKAKRSRFEVNNTRTNKRLKNDSTYSSSKFKGVVCQQNGHWGAQIYAKHQRIWLGTFKSEKEAAMAYDSASINLRKGDSSRNFPWTTTITQESNFQSQFSTETILTMIKDGSYVSKFEDYLNEKLQTRDLKVGRDLGVGPGKEAYSCRQLFQKELTPSDVGKLNRLVIPKKNAVKYFPHTSEDEVENGLQQEEVQLVFYDKSMRLWKFRYCYWKSSQSFVFTRGWSKFVREKGLKEKDTIIFSHCECNDGVNVVSSFGQIDVNYYNRLENKSGYDIPLGSVAEIIKNIGTLNYVNKELEQIVEPGRSSDVTEEENEEDGTKATALIEFLPTEKRGFRLFGVQINLKRNE